MEEDLVLEKPGKILENGCSSRGIYHAKCVA